MIIFLTVAPAPHLNSVDDYLLDCGFGATPWREFNLDAQYRRRNCYFRLGPTAPDREIRTSGTINAILEAFQ